MSDIRTVRMAKRKQESRDIAKKIIEFGVTEDQKIDIMFNIAMTLESTEAMKSITSELKNFIEKINNDEEEDNNSTVKGKIIT
tara:strand:- start:87 stop:335 length:249 start_codon:yes stop_codon:yes gene_type:complete